MLERSILILGQRKTPTIDSIESYLSAHLNLAPFFLSAEAIVNQLEIHDRVLSRDDISVEWSYSGCTFSSKAVRGVLNLLPYLDIGLFSTFEEVDQRYAQAEFSAYLLFALAQFKNVINPPWGGSIAGFCNSLPYQWLFVDSCKTPIRTPQFFFGMPEDAPIDLLQGVNTVYSTDVFDGRNWKTEPVPALPRQEPVFLYQRPRGHPIVITALDDSWWFHSLSKAPIPTSTLEPLHELIPRMRSHFHVRLAEMLCFVDTTTSRLTFGSVQPGVEIEFLDPSQREVFLFRLGRALSSVS